MTRIAPALAAVGLVGVLLAACRSEMESATYRVQPQDFVQKVTAEGALEAVTVTPVTVPPEVKSAVRIAWLAPEAARVEKDELVARFDAGTLEENLKVGRSSRESAGFRIVETESTSEAETADLVTQLELARLEIELANRFQKSDETVWSRHEILTSRIDEGLARERETHAEEKRKTQERRVASDLDLLAIERRQADLRIEEAEAGLAALEVRAPHAGLFLRAKDWTGQPVEVGQEMWRGRPIGEIPDLSKMQARVHVLEADAGGIAEGRPVDVVLESRPGQVLRGTVSRVDAVAKPREQGSPVQYFGVTIALDETNPELMKPGQRVLATIYVAREEGALVVPRQAIERAEDGHRVFVRNGEGLEPRAVTLGPGSRGLVTIVEGLAAGEVIALTPPESPEGLSGEETSEEGGEEAADSSDPGVAAEKTS